LFFVVLIVKQRENREGLLHAIRHTVTKPGGSHRGREPSC